MYDGYFHTSDILPTLASAVGINIDSVDGYDQWNVLSNGGISPRKEIVSSLDIGFGYSSIISDQWKFINGTSYNGKNDGYLGVIDRFDLTDDSYTYLILTSKVGKVLGETKNLTADKILNLREKSTVICKDLQNPMINCDPMKGSCLFNIIDDPCERTNLADTYPSILSTFHQKMNDLIQNAHPIRRNDIPDPRCDPRLHNGTWNSWVIDEKVEILPCQGSSFSFTCFPLIIFIYFVWKIY